MKKKEYRFGVAATCKPKFSAMTDGGGSLIVVPESERN
jgi:hypothetical protein